MACGCVTYLSPLPLQAPLSYPKELHTATAYYLLLTTYCLLLTNVQAPLSYPKERGMRLSTVAVGDTFLNPGHPNPNPNSNLNPNPNPTPNPNPNPNPNPSPYT